MAKNDSTDVGTGSSPAGVTPSVGAPVSGDRANRGRPVLGGGGPDTAELFDVMSEGEPMTKDAASLLRPTSGGQSFTTGDFRPLGRKPGGSFAGSDASAAALREIGGLRKTTVNSSVESHEKVDIPSEGGPDSQRNG